MRTVAVLVLCGALAGCGDSVTVAAKETSAAAGRVSDSGVTTPAAPASDPRSDPFAVDANPFVEGYGIDWAAAGAPWEEWKAREPETGAPAVWWAAGVATFGYPGAWKVPGVKMTVLNNEGIIVFGDPTAEDAVLETASDPNSPTAVTGVPIRFEVHVLGESKPLGPDPA